MKYIPIFEKVIIAFLVVMMIIIFVAIIALAIKIRIIDFSDYEATTMLGPAALLITLAESYFLLKQSDHIFGASGFIKKDN